MKRIMSIVLSAALIFSLVPVIIYAGTLGEQMNTSEIYDNFKKIDRHLYSELFPINNWTYRSLASEIEDNKLIYKAVEVASKVQRVYPDKKQCVEMLTNYITLQSMSAAEQAAAQKNLDHTKKNLAEGGIDVDVKDILDLGLDFIDGAGLLEEYGPLIDTIMGGAEFLKKNSEAEKSLETILRNHDQAKTFLQSVASQAKDPDMRGAAEALLGSYDALLETQLEYLNEHYDEITTFNAEFFLKNMYIDVIRNMDIYNGDAVSEWWLDHCEKGIEKFSTGIKAGKFTYKMIILAGDTAFGTTNTYIRYQEMRLTSDIAQALLHDINLIQVTENDSRDEMLYKIQKKLELYKLLLSIHGRGEYCLHELTANEGGLFSHIQRIKDIFEKGSGETYDGIYDQQLSKLDNLEYEIDRFQKKLAEPAAEPETEPETEPESETQPEVQCEKVPYSRNLVLRNYGLSTNPEYAFGTDIRKQEVSAIEFLDSLDHAPEDAWDVSETGNGRVLAWPEKDGELYKLYIAGDGAVFFPEDSSYLFAGSYLVKARYSSLEKINFSDVVDTSMVNSMEGMFGRCEKLKELDLTGFDTEAVTDMNSMFDECKGLEKLDLSTFNTSHVTEMYLMFSKCSSIKKLDLSNFVTSNVENMSYMFDGCSSLKELDISGFSGESLLSGRHTGPYLMFLSCPKDMTIKADPQIDSRIRDQFDLK